MSRNADELLTKWKAALEAYTKADVELKRYCDENGLALSRCDCCGKETLAAPEPLEKPDGKGGSVLRWNFCSDDCRARYWTEKPAAWTSRQNNV